MREPLFFQARDALQCVGTLFFQYRSDYDFASTSCDIERKAYR